MDPSFVEKPKKIGKFNWRGETLSTNSAISIQSIQEIALSYGYKVLWTEDFENTETLSPITRISYVCQAGHKFTMIAQNYRNQCEICAILNNLRKHSMDIQCTQNSYSQGQTQFEFVCEYGHRTICNVRNSVHGCRSCELLAQARKKHGVGSALSMDIYCLNVHENSRMRFHCNKLRHDPNCPNEACKDAAKYARGMIKYAPDCTNFVPCNQDFYASAKKILARKATVDVLDCDNDHRWVPYEIVTLARMFELYFGARFDDEIYAKGIEFTGYNAKLKLAFTHMEEINPSQCVGAARKWCAENDVTFIVIPKNIKDTGMVAEEVMRQLYCAGWTDDYSQQYARMELRTPMRKYNDAHKLYDDRCIFLGSL